MQQNEEGKSSTWKSYLARILPTPALLPTGATDFSGDFRSENKSTMTFTKTKKLIYQKVVNSTEVIEWVLLFAHHIFLQNQRYNLINQDLISKD